MTWPSLYNFCSDCQLHQIEKLTAGQIYAPCLGINWGHFLPSKGSQPALPGIHKKHHPVNK